LGINEKTATAMRIQPMQKFEATSVELLLERRIATSSDSTSLSTPLSSPQSSREAEAHNFPASVAFGVDEVSFGDPEIDNLVYIKFREFVSLNKRNCEAECDDGNLENVNVSGTRPVDIWD
jgi:hypothetical protein